MKTMAAQVDFCLSLYLFSISRAIRGLKIGTCVVNEVLTYLLLSPSFCNQPRRMERKHRDVVLSSLGGRVYADVPTCYHCQAYFYGSVSMDEECCRKVSNGKRVV